MIDFKAILGCRAKNALLVIYATPLLLAIADARDVTATLIPKPVIQIPDIVL